MNLFPCPPWQSLRRLLLLCTLFGTVSCANTSHLFIYQHSNFGFNAGTSPQSGNIHVGIGLRRDFACVIPKIDSGDKATPNIRAASSYVVSRVRTKSPFAVPDIAEIIATGEAADQMGNKTDALSPFVTPKKD
jgi:hypothetical protein